jgi:hypothetical protein
MTCAAAAASHNKRLLVGNCTCHVLVLALASVALRSLPKAVAVQTRVQVVQLYCSAAKVQLSLSKHGLTASQNK